MLNGSHVLEGLRDMGKLVMVASYVGYYIEGVPPEASLTALMEGLLFG